jgi:uncharacterized membrane protein
MDRGETMRRQSDFWGGFAAGVGSGLAALLAWKGFSSARESRILRLERSLQIGKPVNEVFDAWTRLEQLPVFSDIIRDVESYGRRSRWVVRLDGKDFEWEAERVQYIPGQAIGWKSVRGPKHTGRVTFAPLGDNTLLQVTMNYGPPLGIFSGALAPLSEHLEHYIDQALRDFKAALEGKGQEMEAASQVRATVTLGPAATQQQTQATRFGGVEQAVEYTRPTQPPPFSQPDAKR